MMKTFTVKDSENLLEDLLLYCGNIQEISDLYGLNMHGDHFGGVLNTNMDSFNFSHDKLFSDEETWCIMLSDPVNSLIRGNRSQASLIFPKIHKKPELKRRYIIANELYSFYNNRSDMCEQFRSKNDEVLLGYEKLPNYSSVLEAIIRDYRSYQKKENEEREQNIAMN